MYVHVETHHYQFELCLLTIPNSQFTLGSEWVLVPICEYCHQQLHMIIHTHLALVLVYAHTYSTYCTYSIYIRTYMCKQIVVEY